MYKLNLIILQIFFFQTIYAIKFSDLSAHNLFGQSVRFKKYQNREDTKGRW